MMTAILYAGEYNMLENGDVVAVSRLRMAGQGVRVYHRVLKVRGYYCGINKVFYGMYVSEQGGGNE